MWAFFKKLICFYKNRVLTRCLFCYRDKFPSLLPPTTVKKGKALAFEKSDCDSGLTEEVPRLHVSHYTVESHSLSL